MNSSLKQIHKAGEHQVQIVGIEIGKSKFKGTPYFRLKLENPLGVIYKKFYLSENSLPYIKRLFLAINQYGISSLEQVEPYIKELLGKSLDVKIVKRYVEDTSKSWFDVIDFSRPASSRSLNGKDDLSYKDECIEYAKELFKNYYSSIELNYLDLIIDEHLTNNEWFLESEEERYNNERREEQEYEEQQRKWSDECGASRDLDGEDRYSKYGGRYDLDDETVDEAFGGDPEWYWNID